MQQKNCVIQVEHFFTARILGRELLSQFPCVQQWNTHKKIPRKTLATQARNKPDSLHNLHALLLPWPLFFVASSHALKGKYWCVRENRIVKPDATDWHVNARCGIACLTRGKTMSSVNEYFLSFSSFLPKGIAYSRFCFYSLWKSEPEW